MCEFCEGEYNMHLIYLMTCTKSSSAFATAKIRNKEPPIYCTDFSDTYFDRKDPPSTANDVARQCPVNAPKTPPKKNLQYQTLLKSLPRVTPNGEETADKAVVARKDLSPHSAVKTKAKVDRIKPPELATKPLTPSSASSCSKEALTSAS